MATWLQSLGNLNNSLTDKFMAGGIGKGLGSLGITSGSIGGIANTIGNMATGLLAGQNQTGVGNIMQTVGGLASNIPGVGGLIGAGVSVVGGLVNAAFGSHINDEFVNQTNQQANALGSTVFNANTNGDLLNDWQNMTAQSNVSKSEVGSDGWFSNKAQDKTNELNARINEANRRQLANFGIAAENVDRQNDFRILQNMAAYGGPIGSFRKFYAKGGYLEQAKALIRQNEGFKDKPYNDAPKGKNWRSVGYGFNDSGFRDKYPEGISKHYERGITKKQAEEELDYFLKGAEKQLKNIYGSQWNSFTDSQKAAILDTYYQRPASVGKTSRFYKAVTAGEDPSRYLGVAGFTKRNNIRQNVFGGGEFTGVGYSDEYNPNGETGEITYPSSSSLLEATSPYYDAMLSATPTEVVNPTINMPTLDVNFLASFGQSQPTQQAAPTVGTVEDYLQAYGDSLDANMIFAHGGFLGKKFDGEGEESQYLQVQRNPHVDLAVNNPWLYQKLHPAQTKAEKYEPTTFAGRVTQLAGASELGQKYADYTSSVIQQVPVVGLVPSALDLGYDTNRLYHKPSLTTTKDVTLDAASLVPALRKTMKGWWMKGNSGQFVTEAGQVINNPRLASSLEVALQPFRTAINTGVYAGRAADFVDDSKAYLKDMYNDSPIGKHFPIKANGGRLITKDRFDMNMFDFGGGLTHGSEFDTGINWVNEGGSHSENPLGGVPMGVDEEGIPNLVEQDEAIWNGDYVFSKRMKVPKKLRDKYKLPEGATFADAVAKLTKESEERPLDEISRATQDHILGELADSQEELRMAKAQREADKQMQLQDDFLMGFQAGFGGPLFSDGGGIHIDPSKRGTFKAQASKMGMGVQEAASHILVNKENYSPAMVKKANFARNFAHADGGNLFDNPFAYGGAMGNVFEGKGNRPQVLRLDNRSLLRRMFGDNGFVDFMENTADAINDPIGYFAGDQIDAIMNRVAQMSEPQLEKFFNTSVGQYVANAITSMNSNGNSNAQEAGMQRWAQATGRMARPVQRAVVNAAKRAMAQSRQAARGQMRQRPQQPAQTSPTSYTGRNYVQEARNAVDAGNLRIGQQWAENAANTGRATQTTTRIKQTKMPESPDVPAFTGRTARTNKMNPKLGSKASTSRGAAPDAYAGLEGTLDISTPFAGGNFGYLPWALGAGVGGYGIYRGADWLSDNLETGQPEVAAASMPTSIRQAQAPASNRGNVVAGGSSKGNRFLASGQQVPTSAASTRGTQVAPISGGGTGTRRATAATVPNRGNIVDFAYDWYRNGSDGLGEPTGFKVGNNGRAYDYTNEYRDLVNRLGADDIRAWAAAHPDDPSLRSFLANGNKLENLTDEQWRKGATDGKYGFMHHVADNMLNNVSFNPPEIEREPASTSAITDAVRQAIARDGYTSEPTAQDADIVNALTPDTAIGGKSFNPRPTWMRQVPIWLSGIMGLKDMLTPADYSNADAITEAAYQSWQPVSVGTEYIGDYRKRDPFDQHYLENIINQRGAATNRNMMNLSGGNRAVGMAGILANDLVTQQGLAEAARQGYIANRTDDAQVSEFNRGTNLANMQAQNTRNLALAQLNSQRQNAMLSGIAQGARLRQAIKDQRDAAISANWTNFAQNMGSWGKENGFYNMLGGLNKEGILKYFFGDDWETMFNNVKQNV